jgi:hypothetical protein
VFWAPMATMRDSPNSRPASAAATVPEMSINPP